MTETARSTSITRLIVKMLSVPHPLALALFSNASMAAEAAAALHALGISREQISVVAHSHADARTLADRMNATTGVDLEDSRPAGRLGELGGRVLAAIALVMPGVEANCCGRAAGGGAWGSGRTCGRQPCVGAQVRRFTTGTRRSPATRVAQGAVLLGVHIAASDVDGACVVARPPPGRRSSRLVALN